VLLHAEMSVICKGNECFPLLYNFTCVISYIVSAANQSFISSALVLNQGQQIEEEDIQLVYFTLIGHENSVGLSVCKVHISATRWRFYT
jgi:hypothetical protein